MKAILKLMALYASLILIVILYSSPEDDTGVTSKVHFEYQQF